MCLLQTPGPFQESKSLQPLPSSGTRTGWSQWLHTEARTCVISPSPFRMSRQFVTFHPVDGLTDPKPSEHLPTCFIPSSRPLPSPFPGIRTALSTHHPSFADSLARVSPFLHSLHLLLKRNLPVAPSGLHLQSTFAPTSPRSSITHARTNRLPCSGLQKCSNTPRLHFSLLNTITGNTMADCHDK